MVRKYTDKELLDKVSELSNFRGYPEGYWLLGVRSKDDLTDVFDDKIYVYKGTDFKAMLVSTTNPGAVYLKGGFKKYSDKGVAVLKSDMWHHECWKFGLHRGKMEALRQAKSMPYYRDGNLNGKSEEIGEIYTNIIGLNFHGSTYRRGADLTRDEIGFWSAGCQVASSNLVYREVIKMLKESKQKRFTYCLINEF